MSIISSNRKIFKLLALTVAVNIALSGCDTDRANITPAPLPATEVPVAESKAYSLLKTDGTAWVNQEGENVALRGINLGNWLAMEMWMFGNNEPVGSGIIDQCRLEDKLTERFGVEEKQAVLNVHRDNWIKSTDWQQMKDAGFNIVRVPFLFDLLEDANNPKTLKADAWHYLDQAISEAKAHEMYVVLDLHGAVGRQGTEQHTGCADKNELWDNGEYRQRTVWLWQQIATKYKDEATIAGYGLLNEPWGTDAETLKDFMVEIYQGIRTIDEDHIVILPAHNVGGISAYGDPIELGMDNVAFENHRYPGLFDWGNIGYEVHRDWLVCGENGDTGICKDAKEAADVNTAMLIGELQPWVGLGELGGNVTRATFDKYNDLNWAATAWSYKTTSFSGGLGQGTWGLVTNKGEQLLAKAQTWGCNDWESTLAEACDVPSKSTTPYDGEGVKTMYLVIKTGAFNGTDVTYDNLALTNDATGDNILLNGDFGSDESWTEVSLWGDPRSYDFDYSAGEFAGSDTGAALRITSPAGNHSLIYQAVDVVGGESYTLSGKFKDNGSDNNDMWAEIYLVPDMPQEWVDVTGRVLPSVDVNNAPVEDIKAFFSAFGNMDYVINEAVVESMTAEVASELFSSVPGKSSALALNVGENDVVLSWTPAEGEVTGYHIYRSTSPGSGFENIGSSDTRSYTDSTIESDITYYYYVVAFNELDEGYAGPIEASGDTFHLIPGRLEAENYTNVHPDVETEGTGDEGGGSNIGHFEIGRWVEYAVNVEAEGEYTAEFRLATQPGSDGFEIQLDGVVLDTIAIEATGGWQEYITISTTLTLPAGEAALRLYSVGKEWNLNWINFTKN